MSPDPFTEQAGAGSNAAAAGAPSPAATAPAPALRQPQQQLARRLRIAAASGAAVLVAIDVAWFALSGGTRPSHVPGAGISVDGWPGFFALYGFGACVTLVLGSKALGLLIQRRDDYYDDPPPG